MAVNTIEKLVYNAQRVVKQEWEMFLKNHQTSKYGR